MRNSIVLHSKSLMYLNIEHTNTSAQTVPNI